MERHPGRRRSSNVKHLRQQKGEKSTSCFASAAVDPLKRSWTLNINLTLNIAYIIIKKKNQAFINDLRESTKLPVGVGHTAACAGPSSPALAVALLGGCTCRMDPGTMPSGTTMLKLEPSTGFFLSCIQLGHVAGCGRYLDVPSRSGKHYNALHRSTQRIMPFKQHTV